MQVIQVVRFYIWLQAFLFTSHSLANFEQQLLRPQGRPQGRLRNATLEDVDDIVTIIFAAFSPLPDWKYIYQFQCDFPEEYRKCERDGIIRVLSDKSALIQVIEPLADSDMKVTAVAIWYQRVPQSYTSLHTTFSKCMHRDVNITRGIDYERKFNTLKHKHIDIPFGEEQLYLHTLGTHPDYQGRGAGTRLVTAGIERVRDDHVNVTLIAQPTAETFYLRLGFVSIEHVSISSVDEDEEFSYVVMARNLADSSGRYQVGF